MNWPSARSSRASAALQHHEARARELRGRLEIHQAESLADLEMLLGAVRACGGVAEAVALHVAVSRRRRPARRPSAGSGWPRAPRAAPSRRRARPPRAAGIASFRPRPRPSAPAPRASSFFALAWPISLESALRRSWPPAGRRSRSCGVSSRRDQLGRQRLQAPVPEALRRTPRGCRGWNGCRAWDEDRARQDAVLSRRNTTASLKLLPRMAAGREGRFRSYSAAARAASASARFLSTMRTEKMDAS